MRFIFAAWVALLLSSLGAMAATYDCTMKKSSGRGGVPDRVVVRISADGQLATVQDSMTDQLNGSAIPVQIKSISATKIGLKWDLVGVRFEGLQGVLTSARLRYRMNLNTKRATFTYEGHLTEYGEIIYGTGSCKVLK